MLTKFSANEKNLIITPYAEYHHLDNANVKIKEPNHLFDIDPTNRKSNKRAYIDRDAVTANVSRGYSLEGFNCALDF